VIEDGSRFIPGGYMSHVELLGHLDLPRVPSLRTGYIPSSMLPGGGVFRVYLIRYRGVSMNPSLTKQYTDEVNGWIDGASLKVS
jgi:hypothetical protein